MKNTDYVPNPALVDRITLFRIAICILSSSARSEHEEQMGYFPARVVAMTLGIVEQFRDYGDTNLAIASPKIIRCLNNLYFASPLEFLVGSKA